MDWNIVMKQGIKKTKTSNIWRSASIQTYIHKKYFLIVLDVLHCIEMKRKMTSFFQEYYFFLLSFFQDIVTLDTIVRKHTFLPKFKAIDLRANASVNCTDRKEKFVARHQPNENLITFSLFFFWLQSILGLYIIFWNRSSYESNS